MSVLVNKPLKLEDLDPCYENNDDGYKSRQNLLLKHNAFFYQTIMNTIAAKNKADYPPTGPTSDNDLEFQNEKLQILLYAILEKKNSPTGKKLKYPLSQYGVGQATINGAKSLVSKAMGVGRTFSRITGKQSPQPQQGGKKKYRFI